MEKLDPEDPKFPVKAGLTLAGSRIVLAWFSLCSLLMLGLGLIVFIQKTELAPAHVIEKALGSKIMLQHYPENIDGFRNGRSIAGTLKITWPHCIAFSIFGFVCLHLIRSIQGSNRWFRWGSGLFFSTALLELASPAFFYAVHPILAAYARLAVLAFFWAMAVLLPLWLGGLTLIRQK